MAFQVMPHLFLVRIDKKKQEYLKTHASQSSLVYMPLGSVHQSHNMEHGQIIQAGSRIKNIYGFENLRIGHLLLFHWAIEKVSTNKKDKVYWIQEDELYNYYVVDEINVRGYFDGEKIVPHPNYIFLKNIPAFKSEGKFDEKYQTYLKETETGIVLFADWHKNIQSIIERTDKIKEEINGLLKSTRTQEVQSKLESLTNEQHTLNKELKKNKFLPYKLAYSNKKVDMDCGINLKEDDIIYAFNKAALYITNFQNKEYQYIILPVEHLGAVMPALEKCSHKELFLVERQ